MLPPDITSLQNTMIMQAMYCDRIKLPGDYAALLDKNIQSGSYDLTHVAFAMHLLRDNGCKPFSDEVAQDLRLRTVEGMSAIVMQNTAMQDLKFEAAAFLLDIEARDKIPDTLIMQMAASQSLDGSWSSPISAKRSNDHTTVLALWTLLEYTQPNIPKEPMIHRPN